MRRKTRLTPLLLALCLLLFGCGAAGQQEESAPPKLTASPNTASSGNRLYYKAPPFASSEFHEDLAEGDGTVKIDLSATSDGYIAVSAKSEHKLKFQVLKDDWTYTYNLASDGTPSIVPLQCGNGHYTFRVMENISSNKYARIFLTERDVILRDEFQPFLRPSDIANYSEQSECVRKAAQLASVCSTKLDVVSRVYAFICETVRYDYEKASSVKTIYLPDVDETMRSGKGICFDYAALAAAMLRSQGIPTKVIFGYVAPNDLYHAWNTFYTEESGWVVVSFEVRENSWSRIDLTFSAGGADESFIGNGSNYTDVYFY